MLNEASMPLDAETLALVHQLLDATEDFAGARAGWLLLHFSPSRWYGSRPEISKACFGRRGHVVAESQSQDQISEELDRLTQNIALMEKPGNRTPRAFESLRRSARAIRRQHHHSRWRLRQLGAQLHQDVSRARMVPAESLLEGYRKMMRDLARDEGREIEFRATSAMRECGTGGCLKR